MTPPAVAAFLRGIERRAVVFARLQGGDGQPGGDAVREVMARFEAEAPRVAVADWPRRFWSLLLALPALRGEGGPGRWPPVFGHLAVLGHGPRAALLLRLVAGLPETEAAAVLGIARGTYRLALQRALPHHADGSPDAAQWQAMGLAAQQAVRHVGTTGDAGPAEAQGGAGTGQVETKASGRLDAFGRGRLAALGATALLVLLALGWTWVPSDSAEFGGTTRIRVKALGPAEPPAATFDAEAALLMHPDFELLIAAEPAVVPDADPAFLSWLAAGAEANSAAGEAEALPLADALTPLAPATVPAGDVASAMETNDVP